MVEKGIFQAKLRESLGTSGDGIAIESGNSAMTYGMLDKRSDAIARFLLDKGIGHETFIGVLTDNRMEMIVILIGILKAGCVIVPLYTGYPAERLEAMAASTHLEYIFIDESNASRFEPAGILREPHRQLFFIEDLQWEAGAEPPVNIPYTPEDKLYIHFTSGTTGKPKAIVGKNKSLLHFILWEIDTFRITRGYRTAQFTIPGFDPFLRDLFAPLLAGGVVCIPGDKNILLEAAALKRWVEQRAIDLIHCVFSFFRLLSAPPLSVNHFKSLKAVMLAGEKITPPDLVEWYGTFGERIRLANCYGPTETTMSKACYFIREPDIRKKRIPVGKPIRGARIIILNEAMEVCDPLEVGEIYIRTPFRSCGYYNDPGMNKKYFIPNPFTGDPGDILYKSGDLGRLLLDGNIDILGRVDRQVKIRGYRVELEEIENVLVGYSPVKEAVVIKEEIAADNEILTAFITGEAEDIDGARLQEYLREKLPDYMIPAVIVTVDSIPRAPTGKVDFKKLKEFRRQEEDAVTAPANHLEKRLLELWSEVLGIGKEKIGVTHHFFELGGSSLNIMSLISKIHREFDIKVSMDDIFGSRTIRQQAQIIGEAEKERFISIKAVEEKEYYPLSSAQQRLYMLQHMEVDHISYNLPYAVPLRKGIETAKLAQTFEKLIARHESLRTAFRMIDEKPVQRIYPEVDFEVEHYEPVSFSSSGAADIFNDFIKPFDLTRPPLLRVGLVKTPEEQYILLFDMHHIVTDGRSQNIMIGEFNRLYGGEGLPSLGLRYRDYSEWQNRERANDRLKRQEAYWLEEFTGEVPVLSLPLDYPRPALRGFAGSLFRFEIGAEDTARLQTMALERGLTLYMLLLALYNILLFKLSGREDIVTGIPVEGRRHADLEQVIGIFINTLASRNYPCGEKPVPDFLEEVKEKMLQGFENQDYPFEELVSRLDLPRDTSRNPLFDVMFSRIDIGKNPEPEQRVHGFESRTAKFDLSLEAAIGERLVFSFEYSTALFKKETIERFSRYYKTIVRSLLQDMERKIWEIEILPAREKHRLLEAFNNTAAEYPTDKQIHELFAEQVEKTPDNIAVVVSASNITYRELNKRSSQLAGVLKGKGVLADTIVGIMAERSIETITGLLAILNTGGAYLPIDPDYPEKRKHYMLADSSAKILLSIEEIKMSVGNRLACSADMAPSTSTLTSTCQVGSANLAYIIYTSGSTGKPKGVLIEHSSVVNMVFSRIRCFNINKYERILQFSSLCFDASVEQAFISLFSGAALVLIDKDTILDSDKFEALVKNHSITHIDVVPSFLRQVELKNAPGLKRIIVGGEVCPVDLAANWSRVCDFYNQYGPTETTVTAIAMLLKREDVTAVVNGLPIGRPIGNTVVYILDRWMGLAPTGVAGELYIGGKGVARGYLNKPELTAKRFKNRLYQTGDLARWLPGGIIEFSGRIDRQVKIRGFRIELGEIENRLSHHEEIKDAVVVVKEENLCAYFVSDGEIDTSGLAEYLKNHLPGYMIPSYFIQLETIPLTAVGKVNRKALPAPEIKAGEGYIAPGNKVEEKLAGLWSEVLGIKKDVIGIDSNFFQLGGHSLTATLLTARVHREFNIKVPLAEVFKSPDIRGMARYIARAREEKYTRIEAVEKREYYELSSAQKRLYFLQQMDVNSTVYNMPLILPLHKDVEMERLETALKKLTARHEGLRTSFIMPDDKTVQKIHPDVVFEIEVYESADTGEEEIIDHFFRPFDLSRAPLMRSALVELPHHRIWVVDIHHIVSDGTSHTVLAEDFIALYNGRELEPLRLRYKDFSQWQNRLSASGQVQDQFDYWLDLYGEAIPRLDLPVDFQRPGVFTFAGAGYGFMVEGEDAAGFRKLAAGNSTTLYMNMMAALNTLFYKYTGQTDIVIGSGIAGRPHMDLRHIIGMFVNTLAMRCFPGGEKTYSAFLKEVTIASATAFQNQDVQFEDLVDRLEPDRDPSRNPLFDVSMVVQNFRKAGQGLWDENLPHIHIPYKNTTAKFDMTFFIHELGEDFRIDIEYYTGIFKEDTIRRLSGHLKNVMRAVVSHPHIKLKDIRVISEKESELLLYEFNAPSRDIPYEKTVFQLFREQVERTPDGIAAIYGDKALTYRPLEGEANRLARYLCAAGEVRCEDRVGIWFSQPLSCAVAILGVLGSGASYVPIDPALPEERIKHMIIDAGIGSVIAEKRYIRELNRLQWECDCFRSFLCLDSFAVHREDEATAGELMKEELWDHIGETAVDEITGGGWISSYTGKPFSKEEMDEYGDNILKKIEPLLHPGMRVLEIGCASGISMYRIAPKVGLYYGTDLSAVIIEKNRQKVREEGLKNIKLAALAAHEIHRIKAEEEKDFDLVIMNSVIQCFHGHNYLRKVMRTSIDMLGEKGYVFIGDIMDLGKKDALVREMEAFKRAGKGNDYTTKTDFSNELFISRSFWKDLEAGWEDVEAVEITTKMYTLENELTKFRYDALITINKRPVPKKHGKKEKRQDDLSSLKGYGVEPFHPEVSANNLAYIIYTSGTTGTPKGVEMEHRGVVNTLLYRKEEYGMNPGFVALQLFSYAFDGFVTGFFTPLVSGTKVVLLSNDEIGDIEKIKETLLRQGVTHFICVPPLYSALLSAPGPGMRNPFPSLKAVTLAGDKIPAEIAAAAVEKSDIPELANEYGVTEGAVMSTVFRHQERDHAVKIGRPIRNTRVYILDRWHHLQPIGAAGELCIGGEGLARGYLNRPELTNVKFLSVSSNDEISGAKKIYKTGDLARWLPEGNIEFLGRIDHQVKLRGFRIELGEIEAQLKKNEDVKEASAVLRNDGTGDGYLCAYIVLCAGARDVEGFDLGEFREYLSRRLPEYMVPAYFVRLDKIPLTRSGKPDRKALPAPELSTGESYAPPVNETEKKLAALWSGILGILTIGIDDNFFRLGGHSLKATLLTAKIHKELNVKIPLAEIFKNPTIRGLAKIIKELKGDRYASIEPVEKKEYYPLSSAQERLFILHRMDKSGTRYNMPMVLRLQGVVVKTSLEDTFKRLIRRHESFRTSFEMREDEPIQFIRDKGEFALECFAPAGASAAIKGMPGEKEIEKAFVRSFDLSRPPLLRGGLITLAAEEFILMVDMHHIISDGTSMQIFVREFLDLYPSDRLMELKLRYKDFSVWQNRLSESGEIEKQKSYWLRRFKDHIPVLNIPLDYPRPPVYRAEGSSISFRLDKDVASAVYRLAAETGTTLYIVLLAVYTILLSKYSRQEDIVVGSPIAGRRHVDLENIIGLFINMVAMRNQPKKESTFREFLEDVKINALDAYENQEFQFEDLVWALKLKGEGGRNPLFDAVFALQNTAMGKTAVNGEAHGNNPGDSTAVKVSFNGVELGSVHHELLLNASEGNGNGVLFMNLEYSTELFKESTARRMSGHYIEILEQVLENRDILLKDIAVSHDLIAAKPDVIHEEEDFRF